MSIGKRFEELVAIVEKLRSDDGCPWDREQTHASLLPYFLEEAYEVIETVDEGNWETLSEELGDILLHVVLQTQIAEEAGEFKLKSVIRTINKKLIQRHPHVFGDKTAEGPFQAKQNWEAAKHEEKGRKSRLDGVPRTLPALIRAQRLQQKASYAGFDWREADQVWQKVHEEMEELREANSRGIKKESEEEVGDLFFSLVNLCRFLHISAEDSLRKSNAKFTQRFQFLEKELRRRGKSVEEVDLEEMDELWNEIKKTRKIQNKNQG